MSAITATFADVDRAIVAKGGLHAFTELAWSLVEPATFIDGKHIHSMCEHLEAVSYGEIKWLVINIPPGYCKSLLTGVFWPAWHWLTVDHSNRWLYASYDGGLPRRDAKKMWDIVTSPWAVACFGWKYGRFTASHQESNAGGFRHNAPVGGKITGWHAHIKVIDDPHKPKDVDGGANLSQVALDATRQWFRGTWSTRNAVPDPGNVLIMQRLHENDLTAHVLRTVPDAVHLKLPARYASKTACPADWRKEEGELLWGNRINASQQDKLEKELETEANISAQQQQDPTPPGGLVFKRTMYRYWHYHDGVPGPDGLICVVPPKYRGLWAQSWDLTFKGKADSDRVAGQVWLHDSSRFFLMWAMAEIMDILGVMEAIRSCTDSWPKCVAKYIEDKANGAAVEAMLCKEIPGITLVNPLGGKIPRANACLPLMRTTRNAGNVYVPHPDLAPWLESFLKEQESFPKGRYDDQVDAKTQALLKLNEAGRFMQAFGQAS